MRTMFHPCRVCSAVEAEVHVRISGGKRPVCNTVSHVASDDIGKIARAVRWPTKLRKLLSRAEGDDARASAGNLERNRWLIQLKGSSLLFAFVWSPMAAESCIGVGLHRVIDRRWGAPTNGEACGVRSVTHGKGWRSSAGTPDQQTFFA